MSATLRVVSGSSAQPRESEAVRLVNHFCRECGFQPLPWMLREFGKLLDEGFTFDMLCEVIDRTSRAPRPSWAYLSAIVQNAWYRRAFDLASFLAMRRVQPWEKELPL